MAYEFWKNNFFSIDGFPADVRISKMCRTVQRPLQDKKFFLLGSISLPGFCPTDLPRKPQRHRILSESATIETISQGLSWSSFPQHLSQRQPSQGFADLCRFCSSIDPHRPISIRQRRFRPRPARSRLRPGFHHHRFMLDSFSLGQVSQTKGSCEVAYALRFARKIPTLIYITHGKVHDIKFLDHLYIEPGAIYLMDRGYVDFARLYKIHQSMAFVTRTKRNFNFKRLYSHPVEKSSGLQCDQTIVVINYYAKKDYPEKLRRVRFFDAEKNKHLVFLTNNFSLPALIIAELYRCRWQESFELMI